MHIPQTQRLAGIEAEIWHRQHWLPARAGERGGNDRDGEMKDELLFTSSIPLKTIFYLQLPVWSVVRTHI